MNTPLDRMTSAYPDESVEVQDFCYLTDLHLTRKITAVQTRHGEDAKYVLSQPYKAVVKVKSDQCTFDFTICIPKCFLTDLCSVPKLLRWFVSRVGPHLEASIVHDWLYVAWQDKNRTPCDWETPPDWVRKFADDVFLAAMKKAKVDSFERWAIYRAVRAGGKSAFMSPNEHLFAPCPGAESDHVEECPAESK